MIVTSQTIDRSSLVLLISNKIDLQEPNYEYSQQLLGGIYNLINSKVPDFCECQVRSIKTSCLTLEGIRLLRNEITFWIAENGIKGIGSKENY
ncbi:MAG: hypothetical protein ACTSQF_11185 [Candidatus Heimdallarchaeaceae archaeon]